MTRISFSPGGGSEPALPGSCRFHRVRGVLVVFLLTGIVACTPKAQNYHEQGDAGTGPMSGHEMQGSDIHVMNPWVRAVPPGAGATGGFLVLGKHSPVEDALVRVDSDIAGEVQLHHTVRKDGMMHMMPVPEIVFPAHDNHLTLEPGGYHIMMMDLKRFPQPGETVQLTLHFRKAAPLMVRAEVREAPPAQGMEGHSSGMHGGTPGDPKKGATTN